MAKFNVTGAQRDDIDGQMIEIKRQLRLKSGSPINPKLVKSALQDIVEGRFKTMSKPVVKPSILRLISTERPLILKALKGDRLISEANDVFESFISNNFIHWGINNPGVATAETPIQVHEMVSGGTFMDIFSLLPGIWNQKWLSQDQVIEFCEVFSCYLHQDGYFNFFLIKKDENKPVNENTPEDNLAVVAVVVSSVGLRVNVDDFESGNGWSDGCCHRVIFPSLIPWGK